VAVSVELSNTYHNKPQKIQVSYNQLFQEELDTDTDLDTDFDDKRKSDYLPLTRH
jgi:hypothetical protein